MKVSGVDDLTTGRVATRPFVCAEGRWRRQGGLGVYVTHSAPNVTKFAGFRGGIDCRIKFSDIEPHICVLRVLKVVRHVHLDRGSVVSGNNMKPRPCKPVAVCSFEAPFLAAIRSEHGHFSPVPDVNHSTTSKIVVSLERYGENKLDIHEIPTRGFQEIVVQDPALGTLRRHVPRRHYGAPHSILRVDCDQCLHGHRTCRQLGQGPVLVQKSAHIIGKKQPRIHEPIELQGFVCSVVGEEINEAVPRFRSKEPVMHCSMRAALGPGKD